MAKGILTLSALLGPLAFCLGIGCGGSTPPADAPKSTPRVTDPADEIPMDEGGQDVAFIEINTAQPTEILLDGKSIGTTPLEMQKVTPGSHEVTFVDARGGNRTLVVTVGPGESQTVTSNPNPTSADAILAPPKDGKK